MPTFDYEIGEVTVSDTSDNKFEPLPRGDYECIVIETKIKDTKAGNGKYVEVTLQVVDGPAAGRRLWDRLNYDNLSEQARNWAKARLNMLCAAVGLTKIKETEQLHDIPILVQVDIDRKDATRNRIGDYLKLPSQNFVKSSPKKPWEK